MKTYFCLLLALVSAEASAREAAVSVFSSEPQVGFRMLVPGAKSQQPAEDAAELERPQLDAEFARLAPLPSTLSSPPQFTPGNASITETQMISVPAWMRGGRSLFDRRSLPSLPSSLQTDCPAPVYRPYRGLSRAAEARRRLYFRDMAMAACEAGVPVDLFDSLIAQESRYNPAARSIMGAMGLAQLMPGTARELGVSDAWDARQNLSGGARYLRAQLDEFGEWHLALSAYNAGPGAVRRYRGIPPYRETIGYVRTILANMRRHMAMAPALAGEPNFRRVSLSQF